MCIGWLRRASKANYSALPRWPKGTQFRLIFFALVHVKPHGTRLRNELQIHVTDDAPLRRVVRQCVANCLGFGNGVNTAPKRAFDQ